MEGNCDEPRIHDREAGALGLFLGLLHIDLLAPNLEIGARGIMVRMEESLHDCQA